MQGVVAAPAPDHAGPVPGQGVAVGRARDVLEAAEDHRAGAPGRLGGRAVLEQQACVDSGFRAQEVDGVEPVAAVQVVDLSGAVGGAAAAAVDRVVPGAADQVIGAPCPGKMEIRVVGVVGGIDVIGDVVVVVSREGVGRKVEARAVVRAEIAVDGDSALCSGHRVVGHRRRPDIPFEGDAGVQMEALRARRPGIDRHLDIVVVDVGDVRRVVDKDPGGARLVPVIADAADGVVGRRTSRPVHELDAVLRQLARRAPAGHRVGIDVAGDVLPRRFDAGLGEVGHRHVGDIHRMVARRAAQKDRPAGLAAEDGRIEEPSGLAVLDRAIGILVIESVVGRVGVGMAQITAIHRNAVEGHLAAIYDGGDRRDGAAVEVRGRAAIRRRDRDVVVRFDAKRLCDLRTVDDHLLVVGPLVDVDGRNVVMGRRVIHRVLDGRESGRAVRGGRLADRDRNRTRGRGHILCFLARWVQDSYNAGRAALSRHHCGSRPFARLPPACTVVQR